MWCASKPQFVEWIVASVGATQSPQDETHRDMQATRALAGLVPTRPSQNHPERVEQWERWRSVVGANIARMRRDAGFTQEALALKSGVSRNVLGDVESGKRGLLYERLFDIADALDVEVETLLARSTRRRRPR